MNETIEQIIIKILRQVSQGEKSRNRVLSEKTQKVLKALEYFKATIKLKNKESVI